MHGATTKVTHNLVIIKYLSFNYMFRHLLRHPQAVQDLMKKNVQLLCNKMARGTVDLGTALQAGSSRVRFPMLPLEFFIDIIPASDRNEYPEYFLGVKAVCE
jgi:hypothetical protein